MPPYTHELWSDTELALAHREGDPDAFTELYRRFHPRLVSLIRGRLGDDATAQDMAQEALFRALQKFDAFDVSRPLWPWLRRIALNSMIDLVRRAPIPMDPSGFRHHAIQADPAPGACDRSVLSEAMRTVPTRQQAALWLRYVEDLDSLQAAERLGMNRGAYDQLLFRARRSLLRQLRALGESGPTGVIMPIWWWTARTLNRLRDKASLVWHTARGAGAAGFAATAEAAIIIAGVLTLVTGAGAAQATSPPKVALEQKEASARGRIPSSTVERLDPSSPRPRAGPASARKVAEPSTGPKNVSVQTQASAPVKPLGGRFTASGAVERDVEGHNDFRGRASQGAEVGEDEVWHDSEAFWNCDAGTAARAACSTLDTVADKVQKPPPPVGP